MPPPERYQLARSLGPLELVWGECILTAESCVRHDNISRLIAHIRGRGTAVWRH